MKYVTTDRTGIVHAADVGLFPLCGVGLHGAWQLCLGRTTCVRCNTLLSAIEGEEQPVELAVQDVEK